jgi:hypothetical protein
MAAVEYAPEVFDKCHTNSESKVTIYSCVQELAKHDLDGAELQGQVSKHVEVHHGNQASAGQRQAEEPGRPDTGEQTHYMYPSSKRVRVWVHTPIPAYPRVK